jgi:hypothetical protein
MKIPEKINALIAIGDKQLEEERAEQKRAREADRAALKLQKEREIKKYWAFLVAEATIDLGPLAEFADFAMPENWQPKEMEWIRIRIPGLSELVADYRKYDGTYEWHFDNWGICCYQKAGATGMSRYWQSYPCKEKSVEYILAFAREQYENQEKLRTKEDGKILKHTSSVTFTPLEDESEDEVEPFGAVS